MTLVWMWSRLNLHCGENTINQFIYIFIFSHHPKRTFCFVTACVELNGCNNWPELNGVYLHDGSLPLCHLDKQAVENPENIPR